MLSENSIQLAKAQFITSSPENINRVRGPPISFRAINQPTDTQEDKYTNSEPMTIINCSDDTQNQTTNDSINSDDIQDYSDNDPIKGDLTKALGDFGYKLTRPDKTFTIIQIGNLRFKLNKQNQWKQSLVILFCIQVAMYISHFTTECADYAVHWHRFSLQYFFSQFLQAFWVITVDPGYKRRNLSYKQHKEDLQNGRIIICRKCNIYQDENYLHCFHCGVCVENHDHHCDVLGNCIAKNNLIAFRLFLVGCILGFILQMYNFILMFSVCYLEHN